MMVRRSGPFLSLVAVTFILLLTVTHHPGADAVRVVQSIPHEDGDDNDADDFVQQVLEEDRWHYGEERRDHPSDWYDAEGTVRDGQQWGTDNGDEGDEIDSSKGNGRTPEPEMTDEERRSAEAERAARERADRVAAERERAFQAELNRMGDEQQKRKALKQKKADRRTVHAVLTAARGGDLYGVLGIRNWDLRIPSRDVRLPGTSLTFRVPGLALKTTTERDIKRQFRIRAVQVHPDKNRDGRAQEAFIAVEHAASVLSDGNQRALYDEERKTVQADRRRGQRRIVAASAKSVWHVGRRAVGAVRGLLGPFLTPVLIICFLVL